MIVMHSFVFYIFISFQKQAYIYICGDAKYMAHDVHKALLTTAQLEGGLNETESMTFFKYLEQESRYQKDVWVV